MAKKSPKAAPKPKKSAKALTGPNPDALPEFVRDLPVKLTPDEIERKSDLLVAAEIEMAGIQDKKAAEVAKWNGELKDVRKNIKALVAELDAKTELRSVKCVTRKDFAKNVAKIVRLDSGAVIEERALDAEERQEALEV